MTLPVPEVRARLSVVGRGVPPHVPRGEDRSRVVVVSFPPPASPPRLRARARPGVLRCPGPLRLRLSSGGGRRPSLPPSPLARCVVSRPAGFRSPDPARSVSGFIPLSSPALRLAAACVGGPAAAPHPLSSARPRPPAWNRGVVSRRGVSRGSASVSRRLGGSRRVASPGSGHPPPSSRSTRPLVRPRPVRRAPLAPRGGVSGVSGGSRRSLGRPPSAVGPRLSPPARVLRPPCAPLARRRASLSAFPSSRSYLVDPASSICLSQRLSHACLSTHGRYSETANGSLNQLWFLWSLAPLLLG